jgi:hypothetical protein
VNRAAWIKPFVGRLTVDEVLHLKRELRTAFRAAVLQNSPESDDPCPKCGERPLCEVDLLLRGGARALLWQHPDRRVCSQWVAPTKSA